MTSGQATPIQLKSFRGSADLAKAFDISRETLDRLEIYAELLTTWQRTMNLVAPKTIPELWHRHLADSAQLEKLAPSGGHWVDFGSGAGFPGLVIAILRAAASSNRQIEATSEGLSSETRVTLVESDAKKCAFLREVVRRTRITPLITVEILTQRIEAAATRSKLGTPEVVSARAVAPLTDLLAWSQPLFAPHTVGLFLKGRGAEAEIQAAQVDWDFTVRLHSSCTDREGSIVEIRAPSLRIKG